MVLFVMVIMLLNLDEEVRQRRQLGLLAALSVLSGLGVGVLILLMTWKPAAQSMVPKTLDPQTFGTTETVGRYLFTTYLLPFEAASVLLLAAIVGAIALSRRSEHKPGGGGDR
jgi:NADH-quinone oxidoreductase subunit J